MIFWRNYIVISVQKIDEQRNQCTMSVVALIHITFESHTVISQSSSFHLCIWWPKYIYKKNPTDFSFKVKWQCTNDTFMHMLTKKWYCDNYEMQMLIWSVKLMEAKLGTKSTTVKFSEHFYMILYLVFYFAFKYIYFSLVNF